MHCRCSERIDVAHHQFPVAHLRGVRGVFERFDEESLRVVLDVGRKFPHLIGLSAISVFKRHCQHLIGLERRLERHITQGRVERIFGTAQQACAFQFFVVLTTHQIHCVKLGVALRDVAHLRSRLEDEVVSVVRTIGGSHIIRCRYPDLIVELLGFAQVGECYKIARVGGGSTLVGDPKFDAIDGHSRKNVGELRHPLVVVVAEEMSKEEMSVFVVVGS